MVPFVGITLLALQPDIDPDVASIFRHGDLALVDRLADAQDRELVHVEIDVHRVDRHDGGEEGRILGDQVAERVEVSADMSVDRRSDLREFKVELRLVELGLGKIQLGQGLCLLGLALLELLLTDRDGGPQS